MKKHFHIINFAVLILSLLVILWGMWVRLSFSGDGCGDQWPMCQNEWIPQSQESKTWVEWLHRITSGTFALSILFLFISAIKLFERKHPVRFWTGMAFVFTLTEVLIGAVLVLKGLTGFNVSSFRLFMLNVHLVNSLLLVGSLVLSWRYSLKTYSVPALKQILFYGVPFLLIVFLGAFASFSNIAYPSSSLQESLTMDFNPSSPWVLKLRILHPLVAILFSCIFLVHFFKSKLPRISIEKFNMKNWRAWFHQRRFHLVITMFVIGVLTGITTLLLLSPTILKLIHAISFYIIWIFIFML